MNNINTMFYNSSNTLKQGNTNNMNNGYFMWTLAVLSLLAAGGYALGRYLCQTRPLKPKNSTLLTEASSRCREEAQIQNAEEREINKAIEAFTQEADHYIKAEESKIKQFASQHGYFQLATENTESRLSSGRDNRNPLWAELRELRKKPLKCTYDVNNPCLESIELYIEARKERHEKIISIAIVLLPNLSRVLNQARLANNPRIQTCNI